LGSNRFAANGPVRIAYEIDRSRGRAHIAGASLGGMVAQELAIEQPLRVDRLVLACTTPGWPYGYPMPRSSVRRMTAAASLPVEAAQRSLVENALSPGHCRRASRTRRAYRRQPESQAWRSGRVESTS
jgi:pimeloyl-ACP methyl ester carboxylesterase